MWSLSQILQYFKLKNLSIILVSKISSLFDKLERREERSTQDNSFLYKCQLQVSPSIKQNKYCFTELNGIINQVVFYNFMIGLEFYKLNEIIEDLSSKIPSYQYLRSQFNIEPNSNSSEPRLGLRIARVAC